MAVEYMKRAGVPKYKHYQAKTTAPSSVIKLEEKVQRIERKRQHPNARETDKNNASEEINKINIEMQTIIDDSAEEKETRRRRTEGD